MQFKNTKNAFTQKKPLSIFLVLSLIIPTIKGAIHSPMFYIAVAIPKAVPTEFALTTYGTDPQMADA